MIPKWDKWRIGAPQSPGTYLLRRPGTTTANLVTIHAFDGKMAWSITNTECAHAYEDNPKQEWLGPLPPWALHGGCDE